MRRLGLITLLLTTLASPVFASGGADHFVEKATINGRDKASLQRGAGVYINFCQGCHSVQYMRYQRVAKDLGMTDSKGEILDNVIRTQMNYVGEKVQDSMWSSMPKADAAKWFGKAPPDLSLIARVRGTDWLYSYLKGFYRDDSKTWGVNNLVFPDVGMPHVLYELQGEQLPVYKVTTSMNENGQPTETKHLIGVELSEPGLLTEAEYSQLMLDLVNFLDYVGEPVKQHRQAMGVWVILFLLIFLVFAYLLKREYWKDVH